MVEVNGVSFLRQCGLLALLQRVLANPLLVLFAAGVDEDAVGLTHRDGIGDLDERFLVLDHAQLLEVLRVQVLFQDGIGLLDRLDATNLGEDVHALLEL